MRKSPSAATSWRSESVFFRSPFRARFAFALTSLVVLGAPAVAGAAGEKDADAMKLHDQAMDEDYLAVEFDKAEKKLKDALKKCGKNACTDKVISKLHVALGTVYGGGSKMDQAKAEFVLALKADPKAALIDALTTPELSKAFKEAQKDAAAAATEKSSADSGDEDGEKPAAKKPGGDLAHTPVAEQAVNTPVPVYIEVPEDIGATKVTLRYKPFGSKKWKSLEMEPVGDGFGVVIPCEDVTTTGDVKYYIVAKDDAGDPAGTAGSLKAPYKVPIKNDIEEAPSLPGQKPPKKCAAKEDCPPGLPGCPEAKKGGAGGGGKRGDKGWGASCEETTECQSGLVCLNGTCEEGAEGKGEEDSSAKGGHRNLVGLFGQLDMLLISGTENVCSGTDPAYACFYPSDSSSGVGQFYGEPASVPGTNGIKGGFGIGGGRIMASYDRQILPKLPLLVGARAGIAFGGSPSSDTAPPAWSGNSKQNPHAQALGFMPFHGEIRATYFFLGNQMVEPGKVHPYGFISPIGMAQVNASVPVSVCDLRKPDGSLQEGNKIGLCPQDSRVVENLDAYQITGLTFSGFGGGATYGITPELGVSLELKVMIMWPTFGVVFAPTLGPVYSF
jgi:hypothetical protein